MRSYFRMMMVACIILSSMSLYAQLRVKSNGDVKIGSNLDGLSDAKLEISGINEPLEVRIYSTSPDIARLWALNALYGYGFGVDQAGYGNIFHNVNAPAPIMTFDKDGNFGIGRRPSYKLDVNGNVRVVTTIYRSGDQFMTNKTDLPNKKLDNLLDLNGLSYMVDHLNLQATYSDQDEGPIENQDVSGDQSDRLRYGFVAQEVIELFPELVYEDGGGEMGIDYISFIPLIIEKLKEQNETIHELKGQIEQLLED